MSIVDEKMKSEINLEFENYRQYLSIDSRIELSFEGGFSKYKDGVIYIGEDVSNNWKTKREWATFLLIHEMVHAKHNDTQTKLEFLGFLSKTRVLEFVLRELRANTVAHQLLGSDDSLLDDYFNYCYKHENISKSQLKGGYLSSPANVELIKKNPVWNEDAIKDAIKYCTYNFGYFRGIGNEKLIDIEEKFIKQL